MVGDKIKHTCKNCGWWTSVRAEWSDLKPKRCMNKKCNTSFMKNPDSLITQVPEMAEELTAPKQSKRSRKSESQNT